MKTMILLQAIIEQARKYEQWKPLYKLLSENDMTISWEGDHLLIDLGDHGAYEIKDCRERALDLFEQEIYEQCCKHDYHPGPDFYRTRAENLLESEFDSIEFAVKNIKGWVPCLVR